MDEYPRDRPEDSPSDAMTLPSLAFMCGLFGDLLTHSIILSCIWLSSIDCWDLGGGGGAGSIAKKVVRLWADQGQSPFYG